MKTLESVFKAAAVDLADYMTTQLRDNAVRSGWPTEAIEGVSVAFTGSSVALQVRDGAKDAVLTAEYGTQMVRPNAVIRQTANSSNDFEKIFISSLDARLKEII